MAKAPKSVELEQQYSSICRSQKFGKRPDILCPICDLQLNHLSEGTHPIHVNQVFGRHSLAGEGIPPGKESPPSINMTGESIGAPWFVRPAKLPRKIHFSSGTGSERLAFAKLMAGKAEDAAGPTRGRRAPRGAGRRTSGTCPFYRSSPAFPYA